MQMTASYAAALVLSNKRGNIMKSALKWGLILPGCLVLLGALFGNKKDYAASRSAPVALMRWRNMPALPAAKATREATITHPAGTPAFMAVGYC